MALTTKDLQAIKDVVVEGVGEAIEEVVSPRLQRIEDRLATVERTLDVEFRKVNRRLDVLDVFKEADFRDLVRMLATKRVLTAEEAASLHVHLERPAA